jgi:hypothetical protein
MLPGQIIHSNVCYFEQLSREGYLYFASFVENCSKSVTLYPMKAKSDTFWCFKLFCALFKKSGVNKILCLQTDNGGEYLSNEFSSYLAEAGIKHKPGPSHSPESNGVAERTNQTINNLLRCALLSANLPKTFWVDGIRHIMHSFNSVPMNTPQGFKSPNLILGIDLIKVENLHPFGCLSWFKVPEANRKKLNPKAQSVILLSYLSNGNGFCLWDLNSKNVIKSRDVVFDDSQFPYLHSITNILTVTTAADETRFVKLPWPCRDQQSEQSVPVSAPAERLPQPQSPRSSTTPTRSSLPILPTSPNTRSPVSASHSPSSIPVSTSRCLRASTNVTPETPRLVRSRRVPNRLGNWAKKSGVPTKSVNTPKTWKQLLRSPDKACWLKAADDEFASLTGMETWNLVP